MILIVLIIIGVDVLRRTFRQGAAHAAMALAQWDLRRMPADYNTTPSVGIEGHAYYLGPNDTVVLPYRRWLVMRAVGLAEHMQPAEADSYFDKIDVATASVGDLLLFVGAARRSLLANREQPLVEAVCLRVADLRLGVREDRDRGSEVFG